MECLGGAGYVEESILPRLYREAPLNGIWEGSGNVICLDVLRTITKEPESLQLFMAEISSSIGKDPRFDHSVQRVQKELSAGNGPAESMWKGRWLVETLALILQGHLLLDHGDSTVAEGFLATRMGSRNARAFGGSSTLESGCHHHILERVLPGCTQ